MTTKAHGHGRPRPAVGTVAARGVPASGNECPRCGKPKGERRKKYCSHPCYAAAKIGSHHSWGARIGAALRGKPKSPEHVAKVAAALTGRKRPDITGDKHPDWKGNAVGYDALHDWVRKMLGFPKQCEECGEVGRKVNGRWNIHWANRSGKYLRVLTDWIGLCRKCHHRFDHGR